MNFGGNPLKKATAQSVVQLQFARHGSRGKKIAYPVYPFKTLKNVHPKVHTTNLKYAMNQFLGPKNFQGEYYLNKYYKAPEDHVPNYIKPEVERGDSLLKVEADTARGSRDPSQNQHQRRGNDNRKRNPYQPFPANRYCKTNRIISEDMKSSIINDISQGKTKQQVAFDYEISVGRIEALAKLHEIECEWKKNSKITDDLAVFSKTMYNMFPLYDKNRPENMTEIPAPPKTLRSRFLAIAETEPFGPVDAANILDLEPASVTLEKLNKGHEVEEGNKKRKTGFYAPVFKHEKAVFRFKDAKVGEVGVRYGRSNRDTKKDRRVEYNEVGKRVYV